MTDSPITPPDGAAVDPWMAGRRANGNSWRCIKYALWYYITYLLPCRDSSFPNNGTGRAASGNCNHSGGKACLSQHK